MDNSVERITKFCPRCERDLDLSCFGRAKKRRDGIRAICKDCERVIGGAKRKALKEQVYDKLGHVCCRCGFSDKRALQIDHVYGGGNQEHSEIKNVDKFLKKVLEDSEGLYQILCANCNWIKRAEGFEHRKQLPFTPEEIERILQSNYGKPISADTRQRISEAGKGKPAWNIGVPAWNLGIPRPPELKDKLSQLARERAANQTPEERSAIAQKREEARTPEQKSDQRKKAAETRRLRREANPLPPKVRPLKPTRKNRQGEIVEYIWSDEHRLKQREVATKREAAKTPEQKAEVVAKRKATIAAKSKAQLNRPDNGQLASADCTRSDE